MPTFTNMDTVIDLILCNGKSGDGPQALAIHLYTHTVTGDKMYHVAFHHFEIDTLFSSPYVAEVPAPVELWRKQRGITEFGEVFLHRHFDRRVHLKFRTPDGFVLVWDGADKTWGDGDLSFHADEKFWPVNEAGEKIEGEFINA